MGCPCQNKIQTNLRCINCNRQLIIRHSKEVEPLKAVVYQRKKCTKCGERAFILEDENNKNN